jgi:hypothetical protein
LQRVEVDRRQRGVLLNDHVGGDVGDAGESGQGLELAVSGHEQPALHGSEGREAIDGRQIR